jgi:hypothetical protein
LEDARISLLKDEHEGYWRHMMTTTDGVEVTFFLAEALQVIGNTVGYRTRRKYEVSIEALDFAELIEWLLI